MAGRIIKILLVGFLALAAGCEEQQQKSKYEQVSNLQEQKREFVEKIESLQKENEHLKEQITRLTGMEKEERNRDLAVLEKVEISSRSGFFDKDKDGIKETLVVYIQCTDSTSDAVKYPGALTVELWDMSSAKGGVVKTWQVSPEELKENWAGTFLTSYYRLSFAAEKWAGIDDLAVKIRFTDYITGRVFTDQKTVTE